MRGAGLWNTRQSESHSWTTFFCLCCWGKQYFWLQLRPKNQIDMTAGIDRLKGGRHCQTKIAKEASPFHSALVRSIKTSADDTLWRGLLKQRLVENRYNEIEPHDCLLKEPEAGSHTTCCQAGCHKAEQPPQKCPYTILQDVAWTARVADTIIQLNTTDMLFLFPLNRQKLLLHGLLFFPNNTGPIILSIFYSFWSKGTFMFPSGWCTGALTWTGILVSWMDPKRKTTACRSNCKIRFTVDKISQNKSILWIKQHDKGHWTGL